MDMIARNSIAAVAHGTGRSMRKGAKTQQAHALTARPAADGNTHQCLAQKQFRRLLVRWERKFEHYLAMVDLASTLIIYRVIAAA